MSEEEIDAQLQDAIKDYSKSKEKLVCLDKKLADFRSAASQATTAASPGGMNRKTSAMEWKHLLNGQEFAALVAERYATLDHIAELASYLGERGLKGLVS